jgi:eukaryotic-like serine/threonine-protein kinase
MAITVRDIEAFLIGEPVSAAVLADITAQLDDPNSLVRTIARRTSNAVRRFADGSAELPAFVAPPLPPFEELDVLNRDWVVLFRAKQWPEALEKRLAICRLAMRYLGSSHRDTGTYLNSLGRILLELREYSRAARVFQSAIDMRAEVMGDRHSDVGISWTGLARSVEGLGDYDEALACHTLALEIIEAALGPNHPDTGVNLSELGSIALTIGDVTTARTCFQRALEIARDIDGEDDPIYAGALIHLGCAEEASGNLLEAERLFRVAYATMEQFYGPYHEDVAWALDHVGGLLLVLGRESEALTNISMASDIIDQLGGISPLHLSIHSNLAITQAKLANSVSAQATYGKAIEECRSLYGEEHPAMLMMLRNLAILQDAIPIDGPNQRVYLRTRYFPSDGRAMVLVEVIAT